MTFGQWLTEQMKTCGFTTNVALERRTGIDNTTISRWRNDLITPGVDQLRKLEAPLETPLVQLLVRAGHVSPEQAGGRRRSKPDESAAGHEVEDRSDEPRPLAIVREPDLTSSEDDNEVLEAIRRDPELDDSAKAHFLNQYGLLRELSMRKRAAVQTGEPELLPYVAHGKRQEPVDLEEEQRIQAEGRAAVRRNPDSPARDK